jgi:hypothetical protein
MQRRLAVCAAAGALAAAPVQALDLSGKITCTWQEAAQDCTAARCQGTKHAGLRSFAIDFDGKVMCAGGGQGCAQPLKLAVAEREAPTKTAIVVAHAPDGALLIRVSESGRVFGVIMAGMQRVMVTEGTCEKN